jgi:hypothetical protein
MCQPVGTPAPEDKPDPASTAYAPCLPRSAKAAEVMPSKRIVGCLSAAFIASSWLLCDE